MVISTAIRQKISGNGLFLRFLHFIINVKAPSIKHNNKDILESIINSMSSKPSPKSTFDGKLKTGSSEASDYLLQMRTEDKFKAIIRADSKLAKVEEKRNLQEKSLNIKKDDNKVEDRKL